MSVRSRHLAERFQVSKEKQGLIEAVSIQRSKMLSEGFSRMSEELRNDLKSLCAELNQEAEIGNILRCHLAGDRTEITRSDSGSVLCIKFDASLHTVTLKTDKPATFSEIIEVKLT